jgi:hypothetical protein
MIMGSNAASNHPISFKYVTQAQLSGAKVISVDPPVSPKHPLRPISMLPCDQERILPCSAG